MPLAGRGNWWQNLGASSYNQMPTKVYCATVEGYLDRFNHFAVPLAVCHPFMDG